MPLDTAGHAQLPQPGKNAIAASHRQGPSALLCSLIMTVLMLIGLQAAQQRAARTSQYHCCLAYGLLTTFSFGDWTLRGGA